MVYVDRELRGLPKTPICERGHYYDGRNCNPCRRAAWAARKAA
jgi:hypothetical protein